jgi:spectinomycin phosphotransferase
MIEKQPLSDKRIIDCLNTDYGIEVATLTFLPLGADMNASVYKAQAHDQSCYFVKLKRGHHHDIATTIITLLHDAGIQQIILPLTTNGGQLTQRIDDFTLMVSPFIEGQNGFNRDLTDDQWITLGNVMRQIHEINIPLSVQAMIRQETYSPKWREAVRSIYTHIKSESSSDEIALKLLTFMKKHTATIHRLVDRAEQLAEKIQKQLPQSVLCHSDIHGGNVLIKGNGAIYIVDWDDPIMAPKERDLMFIGGGVANVWNKLRGEKLFYKGYGKTEVNMTILAYYRHERIVEDIALYGQQLLLTTLGGQDRIESYNHFIAQFEPNGVVDIAFKTDRI